MRDDNSVPQPQQDALTAAHAAAVSPDFKLMENLDTWFKSKGVQNPNKLQKLIMAIQQQPDLKNVLLTGMNMSGKMTVLVPAIVLTAMQHNLALRTADGSTSNSKEIPKRRRKATRSAPIVLAQVSHQASALDLNNRIMEFVNFLKANGADCNIKVFCGFGGMEKMRQHFNEKRDPEKKNPAYSQYDIIISTPGYLDNMFESRVLDLQELQWVLFKPVEEVIPDNPWELKQAMEASAKGDVRFSHPACNLNQLLVERNSCENGKQFAMTFVAGELDKEKMNILQDRIMSGKLKSQEPFLQVHVHGPLDEFAGDVVNTFFNVNHTRYQDFEEISPMVKQLYRVTGQHVSDDLDKDKTFLRECALIRATLHCVEKKRSKFVIVCASREECDKYSTWLNLICYPNFSSPYHSGDKTHEEKHVMQLALHQFQMEYSKHIDRKMCLLMTPTLLSMSNNIIGEITIILFNPARTVEAKRNGGAHFWKSARSRAANSEKPGELITLYSTAGRSERQFNYEVSAYHDAHGRANNLPSDFRVDLDREKDQILYERMHDVEENKQKWKDVN